jgi:tetratricopeptide (TPR) repeat protein
LTLLWLATQINITSFNGRLIHFRIAVDQIVSHPLLGVGPGHKFLNSHYAGKSEWLADSQYSQDHPLWVLSVLSIFPLFHSHNLILEVSAGLGLLGLAAFLWFLVEFFRFGLRIRGTLRGSDRILLTGCLVGTVAALGWGLLDVMEISPPFFAFPTWALVGLVWAAPRAFGVDPVMEVPKSGWLRPAHRLGSRLLPHLSSRAAHTLRLISLFILAIVAVLMPLGGNLRYKVAHTAFQEQRWAGATDGLARAARWERLNAKYQQLRAETLINQGRHDEAAAAYERAAKLKRGFAPYHAQLGWLAWLEGDLEQATAQFEQAVAMDPREAWRDGLHADLALAYTAQGRMAEAIPMFQETIQLDPQLAGASYWKPVQNGEGAFDVLLDPVYLSDPSSELKKRILAHLGQADHTPRLFEPTATNNPLTLNKILDRIETEYQVALEQQGREAPRLLATVAEAARYAGLENRAERTYLAFQAAFPKSAYGYRDLGTLYLKQGHLVESQQQLEQAVQVSPQDTASWLALAESYLGREMLDEAQTALDTVYAQEPLEPDLYTLQAQLHRQRGESTQAAEALAKALVIEESIPNRLALADLYRQLGDGAQASEQCTAALDALLRTWPRPLDPQLWEIGRCLAQSPGELPPQVTKLARDHPLAGNVLLGHAHRARDELEQALAAYQAAAGAIPDQGAPHYFLGETYQALGQLEPATAEYRLAADLDPLESLPWLSLGRMQWAQGQQEAAVASFEAAAKTTPGWGPAQMALGNALLALGDASGAAEHFRQAQLADGDLAEGLVYDFAAQLGAAHIEAPGPEYVRNDHFTIEGQQRRVLFMHPPSQAHYTVDLPAGGAFAFDVALSPDSWAQPGDGVTFSVYVESDQGTEQAFSTYIDPKQNEADRRWHPLSVDLSAYAGQTVTLTLETTSGPSGDDRFDWAGWAWPRLLVP